MVRNRNLVQPKCAFSCTFSRIASPKMLTNQTVTNQFMLRIILFEKAGDSSMLHDLMMCFLKRIGFHYKQENGTKIAQKDIAFQVLLGVMMLWWCLSHEGALETFLSMRNPLTFKGDERLGKHQQVSAIQAPTMRPPRASTSRTRVPFARPPMLGLQLISPTLAAGDGVTSTV